MRRFLLLLAFTPMVLCAQKVYLIGDAGEPKNPDKNLQLLSEKFSSASENDLLIFLGDNLYPKVLPSKEDP